MKKVLLIAAILAVSCAKQDELATLSFGLKGVTEHSMTKAYVDDVQAIIASRMPETITLQLTRTKSGKHYSVATGETITLPVGEYTVTASIAPASVAAFPRPGMWSSSTPSISINESITIVAGTSSYALTPTFNCFAIAALEECASYSYKHQSATGSVTGNGIKVGFFQWDNNYELTVTAIPTDYDARDDTKFTFGGVGVHATNGKFYVLHPDTVTTEEGGFTFDTGTWIEGNI